VRGVLLISDPIVIHVGVELTYFLHNISEILLKVALNTIPQSTQWFYECTQYLLPLVTVCN